MGSLEGVYKLSFRLTCPSATRPVDRQMLRAVPRSLMPGLVTILANPECPHCVHATDTVAAWCEEVGLPVAGMDVLHHPELAAKMRIEHSPTLLFDRGGGSTSVFSGLPTHEEFLAFAR